MEDHIHGNEAGGLGTPEELDQLVAILVRRVKVWQRPPFGDGEMHRLADDAEPPALATDERDGDEYLMEIELTAEEHGVWLRAVSRCRRDIDPALTEAQCFELVLKAFLRLHGRARCSCA
jgi:hypothetical protein